MFWKTWFKKKQPISSIQVDLKITTCKECRKFNLGTEIYDLFEWRTSHAMSYDKENEEILLAEEQVMRIIQMVNPWQKPRKIRLVSQEEKVME